MLIVFLQLGVSSVDELRQILGTDVDNSHKRKAASKDDNKQSKETKDDVAQSDEIVYKDSSTFLKVN